MKAIVITLILLLTARFAFGQQSQQDREGFVLGITAGMGYLSLSGNNTGVSDGADISLPNLKAGWMVTPRLAALVSLPGVPYEQGNIDRSIDGIIPSVQYWAKPKWWVSGGFGLGLDLKAFYEDEGKNHVGTACQFSTGYELFRKGRFVFDLQGTLFAAKVDTDYGSRAAVSFLTGIGINFN